VHYVVLCLLSALLLSAGCGDDASPVTADDAASFLEGIRVAHCRHLTRCGLYDTVEGCLTVRRDFGDSERAARVLNRYHDRWVAAVERGTVVFSRDEANACLAALEHGHCDQATDIVIDTSACARAMRPTAAAGELTRFSFECESGAWVDDAPYCDTATTCCAIACADGSAPPTPPMPPTGPTTGDACTRLEECPYLHGCVDGVCMPAPDACMPEWQISYCRHFGHACGRGGCAPRRGLGERCSGPDGRDCRRDLVCSDAGRCAVPSIEIIAEGERCALGDRCADGLYCGSEGDTPRVCRPLLADGATCFAAYQCTSGGCRGGVCAGPLTCP
jgi:hypothetical protein